MTYCTDGFSTRLLLNIMAQPIYEVSNTHQTLRHLFSTGSVRNIKLISVRQNPAICIGLKCVQENEISEIHCPWTAGRCEIIEHITK